MGVRGLETTRFSAGKSGVRTQSGAENGAQDDESATLAAAGPAVDPVLMRFLDAWDRLSDAERLRLVDEAKRRADAT